MYSHGAVLFCFMSQEKYHLDRLVCFFSGVMETTTYVYSDTCIGCRSESVRFCFCVCARVCVKVAVQLPNEIDKEIHPACSMYVTRSFFMRSNKIPSS